MSGIVYIGRDTVLVKDVAVANNDGLFSITTAM